MTLLAIPVTLFDVAVAPAIMGLGFAGAAYFLFWQFRWV